MKREAIIACHTKTTKPADFDTLFAKKYPDYGSAEPLLPEFTKHVPEITNSKFNKSTKGQESIDNTVSFCSKLSRVTVNKVILEDVLKRRAGHDIFANLEKEDSKEKKWYYVDDGNGSINGPLNSVEMDERFQLHKLNQNTRIKTKEDDDYYPFLNMVNRYYKNVLKEQLELEKGPAKLSNKFINFRKGTALPHHKWTKDNFEMKNREERVVSMLPKPTFLHLKDMLPADSDDEEESYYQRLRANTLTK